MRQLKYIALFLILMILVVLLENLTNIDTFIEDNFYDLEKNKWIISGEEHSFLRMFFYDGAKVFVALIGTICVVYMLSSIWIKKWRWNFAAVLTVLLSTMSVSAFVGELKGVTNVYCPNQLDIYESKYPYIRLLESYPSGFNPQHKGRCFPAGHVTGAFSLMSLFFVFRDRKNKYLALGFAISFGCVTGAYQMLRGEHFISHNLFSALIAAVLIIIINSSIIGTLEYVKKRCKKRIEA